MRVVVRRAPRAERNLRVRRLLRSRGVLGLALGQHGHIRLVTRDRLSGLCHARDADVDRAVAEVGLVDNLLGDHDHRDTLEAFHRRLASLGHLDLDRRAVDRELADGAARAETNHALADRVEHVKPAVVEHGVPVEVHVEQAPRDALLAEVHAKRSAVGAKELDPLPGERLAALGREQEGDGALIPVHVRYDRALVVCARVLDDGAVLGVRRREHAGEPRRERRDPPDRAV